MTVSRVGILGAGAVGASLASMFHDAWEAHRAEAAPPPPGASAAAVPPPAVTLIADGERAVRLATLGITVNGATRMVPVAGSGEFDLVIVATKSTQLEAALPLVARAAGANALVMSLLNGITSEAILSTVVDPGRIIPAMILGIDAMTEAGGIRYLNRGTIHFGGDAGLHPVSETALAAIGAALDAAGIPNRISPDITRTLWWKFMINVGINQASAVLRADYGVFQRSHHARELMLDAMNEVIELSRLEGTGLTHADIDEWERTLTRLDPSGRTSMLQDVLAGRPTEVDLFAGTVIEIAARHGFPVPVNRTFFRILRAIENNAPKSS